MAQLYRGNDPDPEQGWQWIGGVIDPGDESRWSVFARPGAGGWVSLKLVAGQPCRKANFWIGWNRATKASNRTRDINILAETRPGLLNALWTMLDASVSRGHTA